jgi:hypothetical protein
MKEHKQTKKYIEGFPGVVFENIPENFPRLLSFCRQKMLLIQAF